jgi:polysaccharide transporter, PST family
LKEHQEFPLSRHWQNLQILTSGSGTGGVIRKFIILSSSSSIAQAIMAVNAIILARHLNPDYYGLFISAYAASGLSSFLFNWGLDTWLLRRASFVNEQQYLLGNVIVIKTFLGIPWGLSIFFILTSLKPDLFLPHLLVVSIIDIWSDGLFTSQLAVLNAQKRVPIVSTLLLISRSGRLIATIILIILGSNSPVDFALARLLGTIISLLISLIILRPKFPTGFVTDSVNTFLESISFGLSDLLSTIYLQADITLLALILGNKTSVGLYSPASGLINALFVIPTAGFSIMVPILTRLVDGEFTNIRNKVRLMFLSFAFVGAILSIIIALGGVLVTQFLLGDAYLITGDLLVWMSPILFLKSLSFASAAFLVAVGWQKKRLIPQFISAITNVSLNLVFIPLFGIWGVATVYVISEVILAIGYMVTTIRWFQR